VATIRPLRPMRVLIAASDTRFLNVARFLLNRRGYTVATSRRPLDLQKEIELLEPNVVVLDGTDSLADAGRAAAIVEAFAPTAAVLIVSEQEITYPTPLPVLRKWSLDLLAEEIWRARAGDIAAVPHR
jgi:DNA-binding NtrC family response regulator